MKNGRKGHGCFQLRVLNLVEPVEPDFLGVSLMGKVKVFPP